MSNYLHLRASHVPKSARELALAKAEVIRRECHTLARESGWQSGMAAADRINACEISVNGRLTRALGRAYTPRDRTKPPRVQLAAVICHERVRPQAFEDVVRHELAHIAATNAAGHGPMWRVWAQRFGLEDPRATVGLQTVFEDTDVEPVRIRRKTVRRIWSCSFCGSQYRLSKRDHDHALRTSVRVPCKACESECRANNLSFTHELTR